MVNFYSMKIIRRVRTNRFLLISPLCLCPRIFFFPLSFFSFHPVARLVRRRCHAEHRHFQWNYTAVAAAFQSGRRRGAASHPFASINRRAVGERVNNSFALAKIFGNVCPRSHRGRLVSVKLQFLSELLFTIFLGARGILLRGYQTLNIPLVSPFFLCSLSALCSPMEILLFRHPYFSLSLYLSIFRHLSSSFQF